MCGKFYCRHSGGLVWCWLWTNGSNLFCLLTLTSSSSRLSAGLAILPYLKWNRWDKRPLTLAENFHYYYFFPYRTAAEKGWRKINKFAVCLPDIYSISWTFLHFPLRLARSFSPITKAIKTSNVSIFFAIFDFFILIIFFFISIICTMLFFFTKSN